MSITGGPYNIITPNSIVFDPNSLDKFKPYSNFLPTENWNIGFGACTFFGRNGLTTENERIIDSNPFGVQDVIWRTVAPNTDDNADGGWNSSQFSIDNTKLYRFSCWYKRNTWSGDDGSFYLGTRGYGSASGVALKASGGITTNPYFHAGSYTAAGTNWFLVVGHVHPVGTEVSTTFHPDSGIYTIASGATKEAGIQRDFIWREETASSLHRAYLFYSVDQNVEQRFWGPRVDLVDGTEPSIEDLINDKPNSIQLIDNAGKKSETLKVVDNYFNFNGYSDYINLPSYTHFTTWDDSITIAAWVRLPTGGTWNTISPGYVSAFIGRGAYFGSHGITTGASENQIYSFYRWDSSQSALIFTAEKDKWYHVVSQWDGTAKKNRMFINGELFLETAALTPNGVPDQGNMRVGNSLSGFGGGNGGYTQFHLGAFGIYDEALTAEQVKSLYNSKRNKYK